MLVLQMETQPHNTITEESMKFVFLYNCMHVTILPHCQTRSIPAAHNWGWGAVGEHLSLSPSSAPTCSSRDLWGWWPASRSVSGNSSRREGSWQSWKVLLVFSWWEVLGSRLFGASSETGVKACCWTCSCPSHSSQHFAISEEQRLAGTCWVQQICLVSFMFSTGQLEPHVGHGRPSHAGAGSGLVCSAKAPRHHEQQREPADGWIWPQKHRLHQQTQRLFQESGTSERCVLVRWWFVFISDHHCTSNTALIHPDFHISQPGEPEQLHQLSVLVSLFTSAGAAHAHLPCNLPALISPTQLGQRILGSQEHGWIFTFWIHTKVKGELLFFLPSNKSTEGTRRALQHTTTPQRHSQPYILEWHSFPQHRHHPDYSWRSKKGVPISLMFSPWWGIWGEKKNKSIYLVVLALFFIKSRKQTEVKSRTSVILYNWEHAHRHYIS